VELKEETRVEGEREKVKVWAGESGFLVLTIRFLRKKGYGNMKFGQEVCKVMTGHHMIF